MKAIVDTSALIYLNDFRPFEEVLTISEVVSEVRDKMTGLKLSAINLKIFEPSRDSIAEIKSAAEKTGDLDRLSKTDIKVLALANDVKKGAGKADYAIISDDRSVQNVAEKLGIKYISIFNKQITKLINWKKYCKNCDKYYDKGRVCEICGAQLKRVPVSSEDLNVQI